MNDYPSEWDVMEEEDPQPAEVPEYVPPRRRTAPPPPRPRRQPPARRGLDGLLSRLALALSVLALIVAGAPRPA